MIEQQTAPIQVEEDFVRTLNQDLVNELADKPAPLRVLIHPGMISQRERNFLFNLVKSMKGANGFIIDAGIFLGASTKAFAAAILESGNTGTQIQSFDLGVFNQHTARETSRLLGITCDPGEPFDGILADLLYNERDLINFHFGDLKSLTYEGGNISVLFLDVMKERELSQRVMEQFCPQLRADAVIIHQDYFHPAHPWIPVVMARNEHLFEYVGRPQTDEFINTAVFRLKAPVEALAKANWNLELNREDIIEAMNTALRIHSDPVEQFNMLGTLCAIEGSFDGDPPKMLAKFNALLDERGLTDLANSPAQKRHFERIKSSVRVFANGRKQL